MIIKFLTFIMLLINIQSNFSLAADATFDTNTKVLGCSDSNGVRKPELCLGGSTCTSIVSDTTLAYCMPEGIQYCKTDSDCTMLGKSKCITGFAKLYAFVPANNTLGICGTLGGTTEDNVLGDVICKAINAVTGKAGRGFIAIVIIVVGLLFFTSKVTWNFVVAISFGTGAIFGAPTIVSMMTGGSFNCAPR